MSIWGKVIGGVAGFAVGGPLGALVGALAGHAVDKARSAPGAATRTEARQVAFTVAVIVLAAKMAKVDGRVTRDEINAFKQAFRIPRDEMQNVGRIFDEARKDAKGYGPYAEQIGRMFAHQPAVLEEILGALFHIAKADGVVRPAELNYLRTVASLFGIGEHRFERIRATYMEAKQADPYEVLGVARTAPDAEIKKVYRRLIKENHPDTLIAQGMPQEFIDVANRKMAAINAAYDRIEKERGLA